MINLTRRRFLQLLGAAFASGASVPALSSTRAAYVEAGDNCDYIGPFGANNHSFVGSRPVCAVHDWDGTGYPVDVHNLLYGNSAGLERYYDFELCDFGKEVPAKFWHSQENRRLYNNVHTYVRTRRFGESVAEAVQALNMAGAA